MTVAAPSGAANMPSSDARDRKSTRLNSSHANISYAVFCLKKKRKTQVLGPRRVTLSCVARLSQGVYLAAGDAEGFFHRQAEQLVRTGAMHRDILETAAATR